MPSVSKKQHNAMEAAAHGKSTLGIPKSVGEDFSHADKGKKFAGGGPVTAASIEAGGTPNQGGFTPKGSGGWGGGGISSTPSPSLGGGMPQIPSIPKTVDPISTTTTPPSGGLTPSGPSGNYWNDVGGGGAQGPWGVAMKDGGMIMGGPVHDGIPPPPTEGVSSAYPPPPGQRKQGPRNYGKKE